MATQSQRWKALEKAAAAKLKGRRVHRRWDLFEPAADVLDIAGFPQFTADAKAYQRFSHHSLLETIRRKYCREGDKRPLLITKAEGQIGECVTMDLDVFADLLNEVRRLRAAIPQDSTQTSDLRFRKVQGASISGEGPTEPHSGRRQIQDEHRN